jgi:hypothetical protein
MLYPTIDEGLDQAIEKFYKRNRLLIVFFDMSNIRILLSYQLPGGSSTV